MPGGPMPGLIRTSLVFSVGAVAGKALGIVLLPILTRLLSPDDLGRVDVATTFAMAMTVLAGFQLDFAVTRVFFDLPAGAPRRQLLGTFLILLAATTVPVLLLVIVFRSVLSSVLFGSPGFDALIIASALLTVGSVYRIAVFAIARTTRRAPDYARLSGGSLILSGVLAVGLLSFWQATALSVVVAYALAFSATAFFGIAVLRKEIAAHWSDAHASTLLRFGFPLLPAAIAAIAADLANRTVLLQAAGASDVAYLGVALRFASISALVLAAFQLAWQPRAYAIFQTQSGRQQIAREGAAILVVLSLLSVAIAAVAPEGLTLLAGPQYRVAGPAASFGLIDVLASGGFLVASMPNLLARDARSVGIATGVGVGVAVLANLALASQFASAGTAAAIASGQAASFGVVAIRGRHAVRLPVPWTSVGVTMGAASVLAVMFTTLSMPLAVRILGVALFAVATALTNQPKNLLMQARAIASARNAARSETASYDAPPTIHSDTKDDGGDRN